MDMELLRDVMRDAKAKAVFCYSVVFLSGWDGRDVEDFISPTGKKFHYASLVRCSPGDIVITTGQRWKNAHGFSLALVTNVLSELKCGDADSGIILAQAEFPKRLGKTYRKAVREKERLERRIRRKMEKTRLTSLLTENPDLQKKVEDFQKKYPELSLDI